MLVWRSCLPSHSQSVWSLFRMREPTSSLRFAVRKQLVALVVAKYQQRVTVRMSGLCRIYRGRGAVSICGSLCDDSDVVIDGAVRRSLQNEFLIWVANTRDEQLA